MKITQYHRMHVRFTILLGLAVLSVADVRAENQFESTEVIHVRAVSGKISHDPSSAFWTGAKGKTFKLHPQVSVRLNDADANQSLVKATPLELSAKGAVNAGEVALWFEWKDTTASQVTEKETKSHGDSVAVQFPETYGKGKRLPYIGMGDEGAPVRVYMQRHGESAPRLGEYVAKGFGSLTRTSRSHATMRMSYDSPSQMWRAVFVRPLVVSGHSISQGLVPVSIAVWEGGAHERGGNKHLSSWKFLKLPGKTVDPVFLKEVSFGFEGKELGDVAKGKEKAVQLCASCHWVGENRTAVEALAPSLLNIGAIATPSYIRESIINPNAVIIRNLHLNRHVNRGADPDANRAYPNNEMYSWYIDLGAGKKMSKMPGLNLPEQDVLDLVAYLRTQDGIAEPGR